MLMTTVLSLTRLPRNAHDEYLDQEGNCGCKKDWHTRWRQRGCVALLNRGLCVFLLFLTLWQVKLCASFSLLRGNCWNICSVEQNETNIPVEQFALQTEPVPNTLQDPENVCCHRESWRKTSTWLSVSLSAGFKSWAWKHCWGSEVMLTAEPRSINMLNLRRRSLGVAQPDCSSLFNAFLQLIK